MTRRYASFFQWHDRQRAELGVVEELCAQLERRSLRSLIELRSYVPDPPDCVCRNERGGSVAVEVTEVVCSQAAHLNAQGHSVYRDWQPGELQAQIERQLQEKDEKTYHGGPYEEILVCMFTDEMTLPAPQVEKELQGREFGPFRQLTGAYLLISYEPVSRTYPLYHLPLRNAA